MTWHGPDVGGLDHAPGWDGCAKAIENDLRGALEGSSEVDFGGSRGFGHGRSGYLPVEANNGRSRAGLDRLIWFDLVWFDWLIDWLINWLMIYWCQTDPVCWKYGLCVVFWCCCTLYEELLYIID